MVINRLIFGAFIPPSAIIRSGCRFSYGGSGVVIHARASIGYNCTIGPCVTIGGRSRRYDVPILGDNVYVGGGAKVLGNIVIGNNVIIGANAVVISNLDDNVIAVGIPAKVIKTNINVEDYI